MKAWIHLSSLLSELILTETNSRSNDLQFRTLCPASALAEINAFSFAYRRLPITGPRKPLPLHFEGSSTWRWLAGFASLLEEGIDNPLSCSELLNVVGGKRLQSCRSALEVCHAAANSFQESAVGIVGVFVLAVALGHVLIDVERPPRSSSLRRL